MGSHLKKMAQESDGWAGKQAEAIVNAFLGDEEPDDLLRLERAIAEALLAAYASGLTDRQRRKPRSFIDR